MGTWTSLQASLLPSSLPRLGHRMMASTHLTSPLLKPIQAAANILALETAFHKNGTTKSLLIFNCSLKGNTESRIFRACVYL